MLESAQNNLVILRKLKNKWALRENEWVNL